MKTLVLTVAVFMVLVSCTSTQTVTETQQKELMAWGTEKPFEIVSNRAMPMQTAAFNAVANSGILAPGNSAGNIDITTNANYFRMQGDTISAHLPYYGERRFGGNYGSNETGIIFDGVPKTKDIVWNAKNQRLEMRFSIEQTRDNELYNILVIIYPNNRTQIDVNSSERTSISYNGIIKPLPAAQKT